MRVILIALLLVSFISARENNALWGNESPAGPVAKDTLTDEQLEALPPMDWSIDSTEIYRQLVLQEAPQAIYRQNVFGIVFGGAVTGAGLFFLGSAIYYRNSGSSGWEGVGDAFAASMSMVISVPLLAVGLPILGYNIYYLNEHREHDRKLDEYLKAENAYKRRRAAGNPNAVNISIVPTINFAHVGGGMNLMVAF